MNRHNYTTYFCTLFLLILSSIFIASASVSAAENKENFTIVLGSGMAEIHIDHDQGGYAHLQSLLTTLRSQKEHVIFLHGGNTLSPGMLSSIDKGAHIISLLNQLGPDAMSISKSDLAHGEDAVSLRTIEAAFPIINSNIFDPLTQGPVEGTYPHLLINSGDYTIGLLSVIDPEVITDYLPRRSITKEIAGSVSVNAELLRDAGADIVILMAGFGLNTFNKYLDNPPVDLVLLTDNTVNTGLTQYGNNLFELKGNNGMVAIINLQMVRDGSIVRWTVTSQLTKLTDYPPDPSLNNKITSYLREFSSILNKVIGMTRTPLDTKRQSMRTGENAFANFTVDSLRDFYHTDIALIHGGGFRAEKLYPIGSNLTIRDIQQELPFNNKIVNLKVSGAMLKQSLENGLSRIEDTKGCFPHVSGIRVEYDPKQPPFNRVLSIKAGDEPIDPATIYTLTTLDFLARGGDGYTVLKKAERTVRTNEKRLLWEYVKNQIIAKGAISPEIDGRMKALHP